MPDSPMLIKGPRRPDQPRGDRSGWLIIRDIVLVLLLIHVYLGIGVGLLEVRLRQFDARCGVATYRNSADFAMSAVLWPAMLAARAVIAASREPASDCKAY